MDYNIKDKAQALFQYIKEITKLHQTQVLNIDKQLGHLYLHNIEQEECVSITHRNVSKNEDTSDDDVLLRFQKPEYTLCPAPDASLLPWLQDGWTDFHKKLSVFDVLPSDKKNVMGSDVNLSEEIVEVPEEEHFSDKPERVAVYQAWIEERDIWVDEQKHTEKIRGYFNDLYDIYNQLRQNPDSVEFVIGNGVLTDATNKDVNHPIYIKRVAITLDAVKNELIVYDSDYLPEIYMPVFSEMGNINSDIVHAEEVRAQENGWHPYNLNETSDFLKSLTHLLSTDSRYYGAEEKIENTGERLIVRFDPVLFLRKRSDGTVKAIETILRDISEDAEIPDSLSGILGEHEAAHSNSDLEALDFINSRDLESEDILLPKPANREQIQVVRQIEHQSAVLVQGPPGTGKTHTIANLLGHFLAQGKTVLVTSQTNKALNVLKEKVPKDIRGLCVALLADDHADMEESVNTIVEYMSTHRSFQQKGQIERIKDERHQVFENLQNAKRMVFSIRHKELETINYNGESYSPAEASKLISEHVDLLNLIPGEIRKNEPFPLSEEELTLLYVSNSELTAIEEHELQNGIPEIHMLMPVAQMENGVSIHAQLDAQMKEVGVRNGWKLGMLLGESEIWDISRNRIFVKSESSESARAFISYLQNYEHDIPIWASRVIVDSVTGGFEKRKWEQLLSIIAESDQHFRALEERLFANRIEVRYGQYKDYVRDYHDLCDASKKSGHYKIGLLTSKKRKEAIEAVAINGISPESYEDFSLVSDYFALLDTREQLCVYWDRLLSGFSGFGFYSMGDTPEKECSRIGKEIDYWLNWYDCSRIELAQSAKSAGLGEMLYEKLNNAKIAAVSQADDLLAYIQNEIVSAGRLLNLLNLWNEYTLNKSRSIDILRKYSDSDLCSLIAESIAQDDEQAYSGCMDALAVLLRKRDLHAERKAFLERIRNVAPEWAQAVENRIGVHGEKEMPSGLVQAWKYKQLDACVSEITSMPLSEAESRVTSLTEQFHKKTEELAVTAAWYYLLLRTENNPEMQQTLNIWKQTVRKIGKGTGKNAAALRAEARKLMTNCQKAVPAWIMPVSVVMNTTDPCKTKYDVIIIDEASQSGITAVPILYMGKKIIVVGDDEQVSPLAVGTDRDQLRLLMDMLIKGKIPGYHLWDGQASLYDIAKQVYRPLMLREHFRCVPDIIGYSNNLSYGGKIKPLREAGSSPLCTAVVPYRVNGLRNDSAKINHEEANAIVALMKACIEQPEYNGQTFGVISLLGEDQANLISRKIMDSFSVQEQEERRMLCGNASQFQGDERDIIFLSMVHSNNAEGPLAMMGDGVQRSNKQRFNVAASRARNQLWIVHSLDYKTDLKPGDIRRGLLEYAANPQAVAAHSEEIVQNADSPFEVEVATTLTTHGYHLKQQWQVGAYRIDMVALYQGKKIAIECDGERWHSGEDKIREDMERQAILERLGWRFIRIRGSEYFRDKNATIERVMQELNKNGILPESTDDIEKDETTDPVLERVKTRAAQIMAEPSMLNTAQNPHMATKHKKRPTVQSKESADNSAPKLHGTLHELEKFQLKPNPHVINSYTQVEIEDLVLPAAERELVPVEKKVKQPSYNSQMESPQTKDIISLLEEKGITYVDKRSNGGSLWIVGGRDLEPIVKEAAQLGVRFSFAAAGGKATKGKPAWYTK